RPARTLDRAGKTAEPETRPAGGMAYASAIWFARSAHSRVMVFAAKAGNRFGQGTNAVTWSSLEGEAVASVEARARPPYSMARILERRVLLERLSHGLERQVVVVQT